MLDATLADSFEAANAAEATQIQTPESLSNKSVFQIVQEGRQGARFLERYAKLTDAMARARVLNRADGKSYKTVLWGSGLPVERHVGKGLFRGDNILPSLVLHPAAVASHPEVLPISAVYARQAEVVFTPTGEGVPTTLDRFVVHGVPGTLSGVPLAQALPLAEQAVRRTGRDTLISVAGRNRTLTPAFRAHKSLEQGVSFEETEYGVRVTPVTPADVLQARSLRRVG